MKLTDEKRAVVTALTEKFGNKVTRKQIVAYVNDSGIDFPHWLVNNKSFRAGRGEYNLTAVSGVTTTTNTGTTVETGPAAA